MSAHTPGQWQAIEWNCKAPTTVVSECNGERIVVAECSGYGRHAKDSEGDARLIAAAPELLAALVTLGEAMRDWDGSSVESLRSAALAGRAAIAKATGES